MRSAAAGTLLTLCLTAGCSAAGPVPGVQNAPAGPAASSGRASSGQAAAPAASRVTGPGGFGPTDIAWMELMIPMDEGLLRLLAMVPARTGDPGVRRLAERVGADHRAELVRLRQLLLRSGVALANPHEGHDMPGMVTAADLDAIAGTTGRSFDRLFAENLSGHLRQCVLVSRGERTSGANHDVKALAAAVEKDRGTQLAGLARLHYLR